MDLYALCFSLPAYPTPFTSLFMFKIETGKSDSF